MKKILLFTLFLWVNGLYAFDNMAEYDAFERTISQDNQSLQKAKNLCMQDKLWLGAPDNEAHFANACYVVATTNLMQNSFSGSDDVELKEDLELMKKACAITLIKKMDGCGIFIAMADRLKDRLNLPDDYVSESLKKQSFEYLSKACDKEYSIFQTKAKNKNSINGFYGMKNGVKCCCIVILCVFMGCKADIEQIAKEDNLRGEAKENLKRCEIEKDFKACGYLANAYNTGRMAKQSDEKALLYFEKACQLRNEAYDKLVVSNLDELESLRVKYRNNPCGVVAAKKLAQSGFKTFSELFTSEKAKEIMPLNEQSCLNGEGSEASCFLSAEYHLFNGNYDKAKEFGLLSCLKGENYFKNGCEYYSENVLKQKPYF